MDKFPHEENFSQPLQPFDQQFKVAVTFFTCYSGMFNVTSKSNKFYFAISINQDGFFQITIPHGANELESLIEEIKGIIFEEDHATEEDYPYLIKTNFSTLCSIIQFSIRGPLFSFVHDASIRDLFFFDPVVVYEKYNLSRNPVDILSFDNSFLATDIAQGMIFKGKRSGIIHNFTMDVDPGYEYIEKFRGGVQWYMMESKDSFNHLF